MCITKLMILFLWSKHANKSGQSIIFNRNFKADNIPLLVTATEGFELVPFSAQHPHPNIAAWNRGVMKKPAQNNTNKTAAVLGSLVLIVFTNFKSVCGEKQNRSSS